MKITDDEDPERHLDEHAAEGLRRNARERLTGRDGARVVSAAVLIRRPPSPA